MTLKLKLLSSDVKFVTHEHYALNLYLIQIETSRLTISKLQGKIYEKYQKRSLG